VTVEVNGGEVTLKGEVAAAKFTAAVQAANEAGAKKVNNQLSKK
jgi:osmotically-inducible protein OsmY